MSDRISALIGHFCPKIEKNVLTLTYQLKLKLREIMIDLRKIKSTGMLLVLALFIFSCAAKVPSTNTQAAKNQPSDAATATPAKKEVVKKKAPAYSPVGVWEYTVDAPDGASSGLMKITGKPGAYEASLETDQFGTLEILGLDIVGMSMSGNIEVAGTTAELEGDFEGDDFSGALVMGDQVFALEASRTSK